MAAWLLISFALWFSETMPSSFPLGCGFMFSGLLMVPGPDVTWLLLSMAPAVLQQHSTVVTCIRGLIWQRAALQMQAQNTWED